MVSNQHYFDYAEGQFPGALNDVEFFSFRIKELIKQPYLSEQTAASLPTELFSRTFFDYEWRFLGPHLPFSSHIGRVGYGLGILWLLYFVFLLLHAVRMIRCKRLVMKEFLITSAPYLLCFLFFLVPFIQTLRFPYFSSMKSMFMLPGLIIFILLLSRRASRFSWKGGYWRFLLIGNILFGILLVSYTCVNIQESLEGLKAPLWAFPPLSL